ncbi:hypothetical protein A1D29_06500 [Pasteurellaceae bacterium Orientalotternb1]|nr:hypothetical protein A1D29_06500 [Pasteurellaceae bacterium Orientalotternb1]
MMKKRRWLPTFALSLGMTLLLAFSAKAEIPQEAQIQEQLKAAKAAVQQDANNKLMIQSLEETLNLLGKIEKQKADTKALEDKINGAIAQSADIQQRLDVMKTTPVVEENLEALNLDTLQNKFNTTQQAMQQAQAALTALNNDLTSLRLVSEKAQAALSNSLVRSQEINRLLGTDIPAAEKVQLETELELLEQQNVYHRVALQGNYDLTALNAVQMEEKNIELQQLQAQIARLQEVISSRYLQDSQAQAEQLSKQQELQVMSHPILAEQNKLNVALSQEVVENTTVTNTLSQENLRLQNVLDNLQQTQRTINDQISALQGTLVLSRIINKQKNLLPQDEMISDLATRITDLRVKIFDTTEARDSLYDIPQFIAQLEAKNKVQLGENEKQQLSIMLQERRKLLTDSVNSLNYQLNLLMTIELNQKQITAISDQLQSKLQQQSFWVRSNTPINLHWLTQFPSAMQLQLKEIVNLMDFSNWLDDFTETAIIVFIFLAFGLFIRSRRKKIELRLQNLTKKLNTIKHDSHWNTPKAILWTMLLALPSSLFFTSALLVAVYLCFKEPTQFYSWIWLMGNYWWYFAIMLAMLHPNGIAYRHFNMPKESVENARQVLRRSVWVFALWINASIFTHLDTGIPNDVLGQVMTISVLLISLLIISPRLRKVVRNYESKAQEQSQQEAHWLFTVVRVFAVVAPIILIALVAMGYYYTALNLMDHIMSSYFIVVTWVVIRNVIYRSLNVSARRLSYQRLKEKREHLRQNAQTDTDDEQNLGIELQQDPTLEVTQVKQQILRVTDLFLMILLLAMLYTVWADLITVAYHLDSITLWKQSVVTETGTVLEAITLLNLLLAVVILAGAYALVRNIGGLLEVLIFSRFNFSQGTPYTITTLITYLIIAIGAGSAFSTLGMSWAKLQWLFAALSVGLGFGLQAIFANFVSGIIILFERPVRIGDVVTIGEYSGTVSKIRIRSTTLIDFDRKEVIIPNQSFVTDRLVNWALNDAITRVVIQIGVAYGSNLDLTKKLLLQAAQECERVLKDPEPVVYFLKFGASTLDHELRVFVGKLVDRNVAVDFLNRRINELFAQHHIEIAFNQLDVFIRNTNNDQEIKISGDKPQLVEKS